MSYLTLSIRKRRTLRVILIEGVCQVASDEIIVTYLAYTNCVAIQLSYMILYLPQLCVSGLTFVSLLFAADFRMRNPDSGNMWANRLLWSWMGFFLSSLEYCSLLTIRDKFWLTR